MLANGFVRRLTVPLAGERIRSPASLTTRCWAIHRIDILPGGIVVSAAGMDVRSVMVLKNGISDRPVCLARQSSVCP